jgi:hypothetical protein
MRKSTAVVASALFVCFSAERGFAQTVTFDVPAECGDELAFRSELARLAGADAERARPAFLRIARENEGAAYRLTLVVGGRTRTLEHADCRVLLRSAAVIAAASVKAEAAAEPATPPPAPPPVPAPVVAPPPPARAAFPPARSRLEGDLAAGVGMAAGVVPNVTGALELRGGVRDGVLGASLGVRYFPARFVAVEGRGVDVWGLGLRGAAVLAPLPVLDLSLGLDADRLSGHGSGVSKPEHDFAWTLAPSAELAVIPFRNKHLALEVAAEGRYALVRPVFVVTGFQELYRVPSWGMVLVLRGAWHFP